MAQAIDLDHPRIIAGSGRSGTTWVQDVFAQSNGLRAVFEPLHPTHVPGASAFARTFVSENDENPELEQFLRRYLVDDFWSPWVDYRIMSRHLPPKLRNFRSWSRFQRMVWRYPEVILNSARFHGQRRRPTRIVKLIRANLMLAWLKRVFKARIVFIVRHPGAVIFSQRKSLHAWDHHAALTRFRRNQRLMEELGPLFRDLLSENLDDVSALALLWCVENTIAMRQAESSGLCVTYYEHLVSREKSEWQRLTDALDLERVPDHTLIRKPSQQAWGKKHGKSSHLRKYDAWMEQLDRDSHAKIQEVLEACGVQTYSVRDPLPRTA